MRMMWRSWWMPLVAELMTLASGGGCAVGDGVDCRDAGMSRWRRRRR